MNNPSGKGADTLGQVPDWENNFIFFKGVDRCLVSEFLELLLGASSLCDFEHVETHCLAQGPALAHCDDVADLNISVEVGRGCVRGWPVPCRPLEAGPLCFAPHPPPYPSSSFTCPRSLFIEHKLCPRYQTQTGQRALQTFQRCLGAEDLHRSPPLYPDWRLLRTCAWLHQCSHTIANNLVPTQRPGPVTQPRGHTAPASLPGNLRAHCVHLKQGERWTDMFLWRFSKRLYFRM